LPAYCLGTVSCKQRVWMVIFKKKRRVNTMWKSVYTLISLYVVNVDGVFETQTNKWETKSWI
jgi:hypothetical protein